MANNFDFALFSDGGSNGGRAAAGACIIDDLKAGTRRGFGIYLGGGTNNEAEICAALLGFAALQASGHTGISVHWVSDSEYLLKSATGYINNWQRNGWKTADKKPVKNQGLWRTYLTLSSGLKISPEHVRGHTGHVENEACDQAVNWIKAEGEEIFDHSPCRVAELSTTIGRTSWTVVDGRSGIELLRRDMPDEEAQLFMVELLKDATDPGIAISTDSDSVRNDPLAAVMKHLTQALRAAEKAGADDIAESIQEIIAKKKKSAR